MTEIVVLENTLRYFTQLLIFPKKENGYRADKTFYAKFILFYSFSCVPILGSALHLIKNIIDRTFINTYLDVASLVSWIGCLYFFGWFTYKAEICLKLYRKLSDFVLFGKPKDFDSENKKLNRLSAAHNIYILIAVMGMTLGPLLEEKRCEMENSRRNWNEVCGTMGAAWWPVDYSSYPYKQIYYGYQIICSFLLYRNASMAAFAIMESTEHVTIRLRHVKSVFTDALNAKTAREKRQQFGRAVRYHNEVINMAKLLNASFGGCLFQHIFLAAILLGCLGYRTLESASIGAACLYGGWVFGVFMSTYGGQRLIMESTSIGDAIYHMQWYNLECELQKDIVIVLMRCQKPLYLKAGPFGSITYLTLIRIFQTSYSYLTLLSRKNRSH